MRSSEEEAINWLAFKCIQRYQGRCLFSDECRRGYSDGPEASRAAREPGGSEQAKLHESDAKAITKAESTTSRGLTIIDREAN